VQVVVLAGEGALGALLARDFKLQRGQLLFPLGVGLVDLGHLNGADFFPGVSELDDGHGLLIVRCGMGGLYACGFEAGEQGSPARAITELPRN